MQVIQSSTQCSCPVNGWMQLSKISSWILVGLPDCQIVNRQRGTTHKISACNWPQQGGGRDTGVGWEREGAWCTVMKCKDVAQRCAREGIEGQIHGWAERCVHHKWQLEDGRSSFMQQPGIGTTHTHVTIGDMLQHISSTFLHSYLDPGYRLRMYA